MKFEYKNGDKIQLRGDRNIKGVVVDAEDEYEVRVLWGADTEPTGQESRLIMPDSREAERKLDMLTLQVQAKVDAATSALVAAFRLWAEAQEMHSGYSGTGAAYEMKDEGIDLSKFEAVINEAGWSTSSIYC